MVEKTIDRIIIESIQRYMEKYIFMMTMTVVIHSMTMILMDGNIEIIQLINLLKNEIMGSFTTTHYFFV